MTSFTKKEDAFLRKNYLTMPQKRMARELGRSGFGIRYRLQQLGIMPPPEVAQRFKEQGQRKPGQVPMNKGKKMSRATRKKVAATWFAKGHQPHNTRKDGDKSIRKDTTGRPYIHIRTALGKWELMHRVLWIKKKGPIPKGMCVAFKNGNSLDVRIGNLYLTTKGDIAVQNREKFLKDLPEEVKQAHHAMCGFIRKINHHVKNNQ
jgi:hypothetical protein